MSRLETQISAQGIHVRFYPIDSETRFYAWDSISTAKVRYYNPTGEYRGWGIKGTRDNRALNTAGDIGIQLVLANKKRVLIGTQKPEEVMIALSKARR